MAQTLDQLSGGQSAVVRAVGGPRAFRRRLYELGLLPGTEVVLKRVAPLGDPLEIELRGFRLSIRKAEAAVIALDVSATAAGVLESASPALAGSAAH